MKKQPGDRKGLLEAGERLKIARDNSGFKQSDLAKIVEKNLRTIVRWEAGGSSPSAGDWELMATALQVSPAWLASGIGPMDRVAHGTESAPKGLVFGSVQSGKTNAFAQMVGKFSRITPREPCSSEEGAVDWNLVVAAHNEVLAYCELGEEVGGDMSDLRQKLPRATMQVYHYLRDHGSQSAPLRDLSAVLREI
jgi:transcriptional regulator with XRE-family HTH domain